MDTWGEHIWLTKKALYLGQEMERIGWHYTISTSCDLMNNSHFKKKRTFGYF